MAATTSALQAANLDATSPVAYFASLAEVLETMATNTNSNSAMGQASNATNSSNVPSDKEVFAYCFSAVLSFLPIGVIQN